MSAAAPARVVVIGTGPVAAEVVRNLDLVGIPVATHRAADFWGTLRLADLQDCYCAVAAGGDRRARQRLNQLSQVAGVDFVNVALGADGITVESFPFGSDQRCACLECEAGYAGDDTPAPVPDPIAASIAGALAAAAALHCSGHGARRWNIPALDGASTTVLLERRADCGGCAVPWRAPRIVRTRNRWTAGALVGPDAPALAAQVVRLSDPVVTGCACAACGTRDAAPALLNRLAPDVAADRPACAACGAPALQVEVRDAFTLGELMERFGSRPVPAKFALAEIGGHPVCFDLESPARQSGGD